MLVTWLEVSCVKIVPLGFKPFGSRISLSRLMSDLGVVEFLDGQFSNLSFFTFFHLPPTVTHTDISPTLHYHE